MTADPHTKEMSEFMGSRGFNKAQTYKEFSESNHFTEIRSKQGNLTR